MLNVSSAYDLWGTNLDWHSSRYALNLGSVSRVSRSQVCSVSVNDTYKRTARWTLDAAACRQAQFLHTWQPSPAAGSPDHTCPDREKKRSHRENVAAPFICSAKESCFKLSQASSPPDTGAALHRCWICTFPWWTSSEMWAWHNRWEQTWGSFPPATGTLGCWRFGLN